jgi:hypothetical protein
MKIIGVIGPIGSGKDTIAEYLIQNHGYTKLSFAARVKDVAAVAFGWPRDMLEGDTQASRVWREEVDPFWQITPRLALQKIGTEMFRANICDDFWIRIVEQNVQQLKEQGVKGVVITDCRFENEIQLIKHLVGTVIRVQRDAPPPWAEDALQGKPFDSRYNVHVTEWNAWAFAKDAQYHVENKGDLSSLYETISKLDCI